MTETTHVENRAGLCEADFGPWRSALAPQTSMERALTWFAAHTPALTPEDLVAQDEFSYDLLVPLPEQLHLSYDTS